MKRVGILLVLAILLLSGCAAGGVGKETVSTAAPEMEEKLESAKASENIRVKVSDPVNEEVNDKVADSEESTTESTASDSKQLPEQDHQQSKSDPESETLVLSSQIVDSYSSEARESDEESTDRSTEEHPDKEEHQETTEAEETLEEITVTEESGSSSEAKSEVEDQPEVSEVAEETEESDSEIVSEPESENEAEEPAFDIDYWIAYAKQYAVDQGLNLDSTATECWDNPITANPDCIYLERDITARLSRYAGDEDITAVWIWYENIGTNKYLIYIGYA